MDAGEGVSHRRDASLLRQSRIDAHYSEDKYRFYIITLYSLGMFSNAIQWITFSPISDELKKIYDVPSLSVELNSLLFMILFLPVGFPSEYAIDTWGPRTGLFIGASFTLVGGWLRCLIDINFHLVYIGQVLSAIGQPFFMNVPAKLGAIWFKPEHRTMATTVASIANPIGAAIGFLIPSFFITESTDLKADGKSQVLKLIICEAIIATVISLSIFLFFKSKPRLPPSRTACVEKESFRDSLRDMARNPEFWKLFFAFSVGLGVFNTLSTIINPLLKPYGYSSSDSSFMAAICIGAGLAGAIVFGAYVDATKKFRRSYTILLIGSFGALLGLGFILQTRIIGLGMVFIAVLGFMMMPLLPLGYDLACEITYPVGEAMTGGMLNIGGQIFGIILTYGLSPLITDDTSFWAITVCAILMSTALLVFATFKERLARDAQDHEEDLLFVDEKDAYLRNDEDEAEVLTRD